MINNGSRFLIVLLLAFACSDDDAMVFEGILLRDNTNNDFGTKGKSDLNDWQNDGTLSADILRLLDFDTDDLTGTETSSSIYITGFPNPAASYAYIQFSLSHNSRIKLVVVNQSMDVLASNWNTGSAIFNLDVSDPKKFPNGKIVRVYYSLSSETEENFYVGHGDILICRNQDCF